MADVRRLPTPPQSTVAEQAVLGALLIDQAAWPRVEARVGAADFYRADHRSIFAAIAMLHGERKDADIATVADYLDRHGTLSDAGGIAYLGTLARDTPSSANVETYAAAVRERSSLRRLRAVGEEIISAVGDAGARKAGEIIADAQDQLQRLQTRARTGKGLVDAQQLVSEFIDDLERRRSGPMGLQLGLPDFDELTRGLEPGELVVIAARPGLGKTALLVSVVSTVSRSSGVVVFSAEMPDQQVIRRGIALHSGIPQGLLRRADRLTDEHWPKIAAATGELAKRRFWIDDTAAPTLSHVRSETIALKARESIGLVLVDYVQLVTGAGANRYEELRDVAYGFKNLAKEIGVPIIVLAQLNRDVEKRDQKRAHISDLRDSGAIEEAADIIGLLYSEGHYDKSFGMPYVLECNVEKNRNGERGQCLWRFEPALSRVTPLDDGAIAQYRKLLAQRKKRDQGGIDL
jgi:replicative DNA helicase